MNPSEIKLVISSAICVMLLAALVSCKTQETRTVKNPVEVKQTPKLDITWKVNNKTTLSFWDLKNWKEVSFVAELAIDNPSDQPRTIEIGKISGCIGASFENGSKKIIIEAKTKKNEKLKITTDREHVYEYTINVVEEQKTEHILKLNRHSTAQPVSQNADPKKEVFVSSHRLSHSTDSFYQKVDFPGFHDEFKVEMTPSTTKFIVTNADAFTISYEIIVSDPKNAPQEVTFHFLPKEPVDLVLQDAVPLKITIYAPNSVQYFAKPGMVKWFSNEFDFSFRPTDLTFRRFGSNYLAIGIGIMEGDTFALYNNDSGMLFRNLIRICSISDKLTLILSRDNNTRENFLVSENDVEYVNFPFPKDRDGNPAIIDCIQQTDNGFFVACMPNYYFMDSKLEKVQDKGTFRTDQFWKDNRLVDMFVDGNKCLAITQKNDEEPAKYSNTITCFDTNTGKEIWPKPISIPLKLGDDYSESTRFNRKVLYNVNVNNAQIQDNIIKCYKTGTGLNRYFYIGECDININNGQSSQMIDYTDSQKKEINDKLDEKSWFTGFDAKTIYIRNSSQTYKGFTFIDTKNGLYTQNIKTKKRTLVAQALPLDQSKEETQALIVQIDDGKTLLVCGNNYVYAMDAKLLDRFLSGR